MPNEMPTMKELVETQGLTVAKLHESLELLIAHGGGNLPIVVATDDEWNDLRPLLDDQNAGLMTSQDRECHGLPMYVAIG